MAAWRGDEDDPFHTEVGYWLWDAGAGQVMRCFVVPRGSTLLAGGAAASDATTLTMQAEVGSETYGILSNQYLDVKAKTVLYQVTVTIDGPTSGPTRRPPRCTSSKMDEPFAHTDRNTLKRVTD